MRIANLVRMYLYYYDAILSNLFSLINKVYLFHLFIILPFYFCGTKINKF